MNAFYFAFTLLGQKTWQEEQRKSVHSLLRELILNGQQMCWVTWRSYYDCWICFVFFFFFIALVHLTICYQFEIILCILNFRSAQIVVLMKGTWPLTVGIWWVVMKVVVCFCSQPPLIGIVNYFESLFFHCRPVEVVEMNCPNVLEMSCPHVPPFHGVEI